MKTSELTGAALDWAVEKCVELHHWSDAVSKQCIKDVHGAYHPSTNWALGGPIIEREKINLEYPRDGCPWQATMWHEHLRDNSHFSHGNGDTALEAAMRCYVASKLGDEVEIPEELR